jgi:hypothetical protein
MYGADKCFLEHGAAPTECGREGKPREQAWIASFRTEVFRRIHACLTRKSMGVILGCIKERTDVT